MNRILALALALALLCACLAGCAEDRSNSLNSASVGGDTGNREKFKIGVLSPTVTEGWESGVTYYAEKHCKSLALDGEIEYRLFLCDSAEDMIAGAEQLRTWGVQAVVVYPQWEGVEGTLQKLIDDGIPVVSVDLSIDCKGIYCVTYDNEGMGRQSAQSIVDKIGNSGTVILLNNPSVGAVSTLRQKGFEEKLVEIAPNVTLYTYAADFTRESGQAVFTDALASHDQIDAVFAVNDETAIGVLNALKESSRSDVQVVAGVGGCQEYLRLMMEEDTDLQILTALYSPIIAADAVDNAVALLRGERVQQTVTVSTTVADMETHWIDLDENSPY